MPKFRLVLFRGFYYAAWQDRGGIQRTSLRTRDRETAERALRSFAQEYEIAGRPNPVTVEFCWNGYRETLKGRPAYATAGFEARAILPFFGGMHAARITEEDCKRYCDDRRNQGRKDGTIWTELGRLRSALRWAAKRGIIPSAPTIFRPPASLPRELRLSQIQARTFLTACALPHVRLFVILAMTTGARMSALLGLTWNQVNFESGLINLAEGQALRRTQKRRAVVPMNQTARTALLEARTAATCDHVIEWNGKPVKSVTRALKAAGARCGLPWISAHVFRHSAASWMAQAGVSMDKIAALLGHSDSRITARVYARFAPDYLRDAAEALEIE